MLGALSYHYSTYLELVRKSSTAIDDEGRDRAMEDGGLEFFEDEFGLDF